MDNIEFYDVKNKKKISVAASQCKKVTYERQTKSGATQIRYALKAEVDGAKLTRFVSKDDWDKIPG